MKERRRGFTFLELILVLAIIGILFAVLMLLINPSQQFSKAHNGARSSHLGVILGAISENISDHKGTFSCAAGALPTATSTKMAVGGGNYNIAPCLVPAYLPALPYDPTAAGAHYASTTDYDTGYTVMRNATNGQITLTAPGAELGQTIFLTR
jgi:prepilin-type N-terminal cleavage/methylation domain-containing protein